MDDVIVLSSDNDENDSDVEVIGSYSHFMTKAEPLPLSAVRVHVDDVGVNVAKKYINLEDSRWIFPQLNICKRLNSSAGAVVDLTGSSAESDTELESGEFSQGDSQMKNDKARRPHRQDFKVQASSCRDAPVCAQQLDQAKVKSKQRCRDFQTQTQKQTDLAPVHSPVVELRRSSFLERNITELSTLEFSASLTNGCVPMLLQPRQQNSHKTITASNGPDIKPLLDECPQVIESLIRTGQDENTDFTGMLLNVKMSQDLERAPKSASLKNGSFVKSSEKHLKIERDSLRSAVPCASAFSQRNGIHSPEQLEMDQADSDLNYLTLTPPLLSPTTKTNPSKPTDPNSVSLTSTLSPSKTSTVKRTPNSEHTRAESNSEWQPQEVQADDFTNRPDPLCRDITAESQLSASDTKDIDYESVVHEYDLDTEDPVYFFFQDWSYEERVDEECRFESDFRSASPDDRDFVCPVALSKIMSGQAQSLIYEEDKDFGTPYMLCRQSLRLVYSTIDENYTEGTLQLLSDLLQPGYYPPTDITVHLLHGILLNPQCPYHLCVQAFNLLIRTQRHHLVDKATVPWDWEFLTTVMANQDRKKGLRCEVVRMLLEYVVQTLEDDFCAKSSASALQQSIAKATLSCDHRFSQVRDVLKWLLSAIMKSTEPGENVEAARERDEQMRIVSVFQRMLSLALDVDRSPLLNSVRLSQELFHMLIVTTTLRAHRMLLLEGLQSSVLRWKLLQHLLDYACPEKTSLPMSLSLLLHFMKNCTLAPDPTDGTERWQRWEELLHLLWMLLLSYNKTMKGYLSNSLHEQHGSVGTYKREDELSKPAVCEAVEAFLSRSQADLGQALPLHVEESLGYLQDCLLEVCTC